MGNMQMAQGSVVKQPSHCRVRMSRAQSVVDATRDSDKRRWALLKLGKLVCGFQRGKGKDQVQQARHRRDPRIVNEHVEGRRQRRQSRRIVGVFPSRTTAETGFFSGQQIDPTPSTAMDVVASMRCPCSHRGRDGFQKGRNSTTHPSCVRHRKCGDQRPQRQRVFPPF